MFVDWLKISQHHGESARELVGSITFRLDEHGEPGLESGGPVRHEGSHSTSLQIRSYGGWVSVSGNPSRWCRPDNLFGFDLDQCVELVNEELARLDLPAFTKGECYFPEVSKLDDRRLGRDVPQHWTGATFSMLHLTENYAAGSDVLAKLAIKAYQARAGKWMRKGVYGDETAMFHNTRRTVKAYRKGPDMAVHCKASPWIEWANTQGIVRHEVELKYRYLHDTGLRFWGNCTMGTLHQFFRKEQKVLGAAQVDFDPIDMDLLEPATRVVYAAWLKGQDVRALCSKSAFYRHRKRIRTHGVDISECRALGDVQPIVRVIELRELQPPVGYFKAAA
jgi:hypothetical protein